MEASHCTRPLESARQLPFPYQRGSARAREASALLTRIVGRPAPAKRTCHTILQRAEQTGKGLAVPADEASESKRGRAFDLSYPP